MLPWRRFCRRHGIATSLLFRWRLQFGLTARKAPQLATVALADGAANEQQAAEKQTRRSFTDEEKLAIV